MTSISKSAWSWSCVSSILCLLVIWWLILCDFNYFVICQRNPHWHSLLSLSSSVYIHVIIFYISVPISVLFLFQMHTSCLPTDKRVTAKIAELARGGVRRVQEMQRHVQLFVENVLFAGRTPPPVSDSRFWPSSKTVINVIYAETTRARFVNFSTLYYTAFYVIVVIVNRNNEWGIALENGFEKNSMLREDSNVWLPLRLFTCSQLQHVQLLLLTTEKYACSLTWCVQVLENPKFVGFFEIAPGNTGNIL